MLITAVCVLHLVFSNLLNVSVVFFLLEWWWCKRIGWRQGRESPLYHFQRRAALSRRHLPRCRAGNSAEDKWGGHTSALTASLPVYFVCNTCIQYPKECMNVYMFLQRNVLNVYESVTLAANQSITAFKWTEQFARIMSEYVSSQKRY